jgi:hypothetical protein
MMSDTKRRSARDAARLDRLPPTAAAMSAGAAILHSWVVPEHLREYWLFGCFFIAVAAGQLLWAGTVVRRPTRQVHAFGAVGSALLISIWAASRSTGLPVGPEPWMPEPAAVLDVSCAVLEAGIIALTVRALQARPCRT